MGCAIRNSKPATRSATNLFWGHYGKRGADRVRHKRCAFVRQPDEKKHSNQATPFRWLSPTTWMGGHGASRMSFPQLNKYDSAVVACTSSSVPAALVSLLALTPDNTTHYRIQSGIYPVLPSRSTAQQSHLHGTADPASPSPSSPWQPSFVCSLEGTGALFVSANVSSSVIVVGRSPVSHPECSGVCAMPSHGVVPSSQIGHGRYPLDTASNYRPRVGPRDPPILPLLPHYLRHRHAD
jgi:hypothetical protein